MKERKFKAYFYLCIGVFFLILTITLYYSFGYNYDPKTGKSYQAGGIVLRITPQDAIVTKDEEEVKNTGFFGGAFSPFLKIENLAPKNYNIRVTKDGFNEWWKNVTVEPGQVAKYEDIVLLRSRYEPLSVLPNLTLPQDGKIYMATSKNELLFQGKVDEKFGLFLVDIRNENYKLILDESQLSLIGDIQKVEWTEDEGRTILTAATGMYLIDLRDNGRIYLISASVSEKLAKASDAAVGLFDHFIIYEDEKNSVFSFDYVSKETKKVIGGISSFFVYQGALFYFRLDDNSTSPVLYSTNLENPTYNMRISAMPRGYDPKAAFSLQRYGGKLLLLSQNTLYFIDSTAETHRINSNVLDARFFKKGERILYYNSNEIWIYYTEDKESQPIKRAGDNELLTRFSGTLSNIYVFSDEEHLLYQESNSFKFTELDNRDNRNTYYIMENVSGRSLYYLGDKDLIYFLGSDNKLYKIDLKEE
jgi:hypothetical protein